MSNVKAFELKDEQSYRHISNVLGTDKFILYAVEEGGEYYSMIGTLSLQELTTIKAMIDHLVIQNIEALYE